VKALAVAIVAVALLTGCGGGGGGGGSSVPSGAIKVTMTDFHFDPSTLTVPHGKVVFFLVNASGSLQHDLAIRDSSNNRIAISDLVSAGDSTTFTVDNIAAGEYTFFCSQPGHEDAGMKGKLTVT